MMRGRLEEEPNAFPSENFAFAYASYEPWDSMCSGAKLVNTSAFMSMKRWRCCRAPSDVISTTAAVQPLRAALSRNRWIKRRPGIERPAFDRDMSAALRRIEFRRAVLYPTSSNIAFSISVTVVFPFVPVTPMSTRRLEGYPYMLAPSHASARWYAESAGRRSEAGTIAVTIFFTVRIMRVALALRATNDAQCLTQSRASSFYIRGHLAQ